MNAAEYKFVSRCDGLEDGYYLHDAGKDTDCIVWLHGHNANGGQPFFQKNINEKIEPVVQKYNVSLFSPHLRGNVWMSEAAVADLHDLLLDLRRQYSYSRFFFVCGSMGGTGGLIFATQYPELVDGLGVLGGATDLMRYRDYLLAYHRETGRDIFREIAQAITDNHTPETFEKYCVSRHYEKLTMPLYYCHGDGDYVMTISEMYDLQEKMKNFPNAEFRSVPGPHNAPMDYIPEVFEAIYTGASRQEKQNRI